MANHKLGRITEDVKRELTAIFRELKDPRVNACFLSIVRVEVTNDLSYCTVYVSALEGLDCRYNNFENDKLILAGSQLYWLSCENNENLNRLYIGNCPILAAAVQKNGYSISNGIRTYRDGRAYIRCNDGLTFQF